MAQRPNEGAILRRIFRPYHNGLSKAAAQSIAKFELPDEEKSRLRELAAKARAGVLTPDEMEEVEIYSRVGSLISILRLQARMALRGSKPAKQK
jgi:hypothetical protein